MLSAVGATSINTFLLWPANTAAMFGIQEYGYSKKNVPVPSKKAIQIEMIRSAENLLTRMKWKAFFAKNKNKVTKKKTFGFNTSKHLHLVPN